MNIRSATRQYESWLAKHLQLIPADLRAKHKAMAEGVFPFLRATFYRWAQIWRQECPDLAAAPEVLGIGDLHVENFGTWRGWRPARAWRFAPITCPATRTRRVMRCWKDTLKR